MRDEAVEVLNGLRRRLESGDPPVQRGGEEAVMRAMVLSVLVVGAFAVSAGAQAPVPREPALQKTTVGPSSFISTVRTVMVRDAKGARHAGDAHTVHGSDAADRENGGTFPREAVRALLAKGPTKTAAHGTTDMPVWGAIFRVRQERHDGDVRIDNLVAYIESIQASGKQSGH